MIDVLIAGAGPNNLMLACELALAGVHPVVLERHAAPTGESRANGLVGQVVRLLDRRGLYTRLSGEGTPPSPQPAFTFGAFPLDLTVLADNPHYVLGVPQARLEAALAARAAELGVDLRRGHEVVDVCQHPEAVEVRLADGRRLTCRFLVGADGGRSTVRRLAGIDFPGVTNDRSISRTATVTVPDSFLDPGTGGLRVPGYGVVPPFQHTRTARGLIAWAPFPGRPAILSTHERELFAELLRKPEVTGHIAALMSGVDTRYPADPLAGRCAPDVVVHGEHGPKRLAELTRAARPLLLDSRGAYAEVTAPWRDRVDVVTGPLQGTTATALLVRPDCFVAWSAWSAGDTGDTGDTATLRAALTHHFGLPQ
ncbi:FAD-dependent monooxygenase [Streptosporangium sp. NPDC000095]|uniref:FAD-dependent monooxygenase n=1 Tax=Streptosporangium sp. NPDC000095 TaxID=3366184 RepID=UPI00369A52D9